MAQQLQISKDTVQRIWHKAGLKPHRLQRYMASGDDPDFERKAADIIGLYLNPPQHAAVFCVDEKSAIQALDRLDPVLPMSPGRIERHGFSNTIVTARFRCMPRWTLKPVRSSGKTAAHHTSQEFVEFLGEMVDACPFIKGIAKHQTRDPHHPGQPVGAQNIQGSGLPARPPPTCISTSRPPIHPG